MVSNQILLTLIAIVFCSEKGTMLGNESNGTSKERKKIFSPEVRCNSGRIDILIPIHLVRSVVSGKVLSPRNVVFRSDASESCQSESFSDEWYVMTVELKTRDCGSVIERMSYQTVYKNEVVLIDSQAGEVRSFLNITCVYRNDDELVLLPPSSSEMTVSLKAGQAATVTMALYRDKLYLSKSKILSSNPEVQVRHFVFVSLELHGQASSNAQLIVDRCFASYFPSSDDSRMVHNFILNGCAVDSTVSMNNDGNGWTSRWKFQMFKWINTTSQRIYLFCEVELCDADGNSGNQCCKRDSKDNCFGFASDCRRDDRLVNSSDSKKAVSFGPVFPKETILLRDNLNDRNEFDEGNTSKEKDPNALGITLGVTLSVCLAILLIAGYLFRQRTAVNQEKAHQNAKKQIQQGFAFVMKSSNDPVLRGSQETESTKTRKSSLEKLKKRDFISPTEAYQEVDIHHKTAIPKHITRKRRQAGHSRRLSWAERRSPEYELRSKEDGKRHRRNRSASVDMRMERDHVSVDITNHTAVEEVVRHAHRCSLTENNFRGMTVTPS